MILAGGIIKLDYAYHYYSPGQYHAELPVELYKKLFYCPHIVLINRMSIRGDDLSRER
jgi:hypothetical protein